MSEIIFVLVAAAAALAALSALGLTMHWGHKREEGLVPYVFYFSLLAAVAATALSARDFSLAAELVAAIPKHPIAIWLQRLSSIFLLLACGERLLHRFATRSKVRPVPKLLLIGFLIYFATNIVSPAFFGRYPNLSHEYLYMAVFIVGATLFNSKEVDATIITLRNAIMIFLLLGMVFLVIKPTQVMDFNYHGIIPGLHVRYAAFAPHPNSLGPLVVLLLACLWRRPFASLVGQRAAVAFALLNLLLTQSKTSWMCAMLAAGCIAYYSYGPKIAASLSDFRRPLFPVALLGGGMLLLTIVVGILMFADVGSSIGRLLSSKQGYELTSFTGRDVIWRVAMDEWERNPIFGYGLTIWNPIYALSIRMPYAVHAHSQFFQSVSSAGTVGLVGLIFYIGTLAYLVARTAKSSGGLSLALFIILLIRGVSEVSLSLTGFGSENITHLLLVVVLAGCYVPDIHRVRTRTNYTVVKNKGFV